MTLKNKKYLFLLLVLWGCTVNDKPYKEFEAYLNIRSVMLKDLETIKKLKVDSTLKYNYKTFKYSSTQIPQYFKTSDKHIDMLDILKYYNTIDLYHFKKMKIEDVSDSNFTSTFLFSTKINDLELDIYSINTKMYHFSDVFINKHYGIILFEREFPLGRIKITKFEKKVLNFDFPSSMELDSLLHIYYINSQVIY